MSILRIVRSLAVLVLAVFFFPAPSMAMESLDGVLRPLLGTDGIPALAAAVAVKGEVVAAGAVGTRRAGADIPVTLGDRFHIGSDTKAMTALLAAMLVEQGRLRWGSTPAAVFPELAQGMHPDFAAMTLEKLLSHSTGLALDDEESEKSLVRSMVQGVDLESQRLDFLKDIMGDEFAKVEGFRYANAGYVVAGAMIERAAGKSWEELMVERVFAPLGLESAGLGCQARLGRVDAPLGHVLEGGRAVAMPAGPGCDNPEILGPAGTAHMSILDFARWAAWNAGEGRRGPELVKPETIGKLHAKAVGTPPREGYPGKPGEQSGYALGWGVVRVDFAPGELLQHTGSNMRNTAQIWVDVRNDVAIVLAANIGEEQAGKALTALAGELYRKYAPLGK